MISVERILLICVCDGHRYDLPVLSAIRNYCRRLFQGWVGTMSGLASSVLAFLSAYSPPSDSGKHARSSMRRSLVLRLHLSLSGTKSERTGSG